jgi:putative colanic acid biosynthesis acetyltransferase WcaF
MPPPEAPYLGQGCRSPYSWSEQSARLLWWLVQGTLFRWSPTWCHGWRAALLKLFGADIPVLRHVVIFPSATVHFPWKLRMEPRVMVGRRVQLYNLAPIRLRRGANLSQETVLCAGSHDYTRWAMPLLAKPIEIGENVWVAAGCFVGPGVTIGELSVVGARSVVMKDLPPRMLCAGHPCRPLKSRPDPA